MRCCEGGKLATLEIELGRFEANECKIKCGEHVLPLVACILYWYRLEEQVKHSGMSCSH